MRTPIAQATQYLLCENPAQDDVTFIKQRTKNSVVPEQQFSISGFQQSFPRRLIIKQTTGFL